MISNSVYSAIRNRQFNHRMTFTSSLLPLPIYSTGYPMKRRSSFYTLIPFSVLRSRSIGRETSLSIYSAYRVSIANHFSYSSMDLLDSERVIHRSEVTSVVIASSTLREKHDAFNFSIFFSNLEPCYVCSRKCHDLVLKILFFFSENFKLPS